MSDQNIKTAVISVQGMTCQGCVGKVRMALSTTAGVTDAQVDLQRNEARVTFDSGAASIKVLMDAVTKAGFRAAGFTVNPAA